MTEQQQAVAKAAVAALVDACAKEPDLGAVKFSTVEVELLRGKPAAARCWIERGVNLGRLLGAGSG